MLVTPLDLAIHSNVSAMAEKMSGAEQNPESNPWKCYPASLCQGGAASLADGRVDRPAWCLFLFPVHSERWTLQCKQEDVCDWGSLMVAPIKRCGFWPKPHPLSLNPVYDTDGINLPFCLPHDFATRKKNEPYCWRWVTLSDVLCSGYQEQ